jgi:DNA-directed RNA polymerase specialized sigma24 family protein
MGAIEGKPEGGGVSLKKEWTLSRSAFDKLLDSLDSDRERAAAKYEALRCKLTRFFEWRGCGAPEDHSDETINRVSRRIDEGEAIRDLSRYAYGVARLLLLEVHKRAANERALADDLKVLELPDAEETLLRRRCLERCLKCLRGEDRSLIVDYYREDRRTRIDNRAVLAERLSISIEALRIRAHRLRLKLEKCAQDCVRNARKE